METKAKKKISKDNVLIFFLKNRALLLVLIFFILLSVATDTFLTSSNMVSLARQIAANGIIGVGYTFLLASDSVDLSAGYMMCMIGIISGLLSQTGMPFICILILCAVIAVICSSFNAVIENKFNLPPFLVTLAMQQVFRGILMLLSNGSPISNLNEGIIYMGQGYIGPIPFSVLLMLVFIVIGHIIFSRTQFGRNVIAVGGNPEAARVSGIDVNKTRVYVSALLGFTIAIMALVSCGRIASAQTTLGGDTVMDIGFSNVNPVIHVPGTVLGVSTMENFGTVLDKNIHDYSIYSHSFCPSISEVQYQFYNEEIALAEAMGVGIQPFKKEVFYQRTSVLGEEYMGEGCNVPFEEQWEVGFATGPFTIKNRYVTEDVPVGCHVYHELGKKFGVPTPIIDSMIVLGGVMNKTNFFETGLTLDELGIGHMTKEQMQAYLREGEYVAPEGE